VSRAAATSRLRCAIYTRKSSEEGLDQSFNSLHAQREACEAYVLSQAGEGWAGLHEVYDDGGFSGGSMDRPGLEQLLADIAAGRIDVVVVYKVDRLTRSLTDFARIVETFDAHGVSFVSVTQAFNTTTSMGRLTLNVLLSFAQFEREVTGERIRDKIAASKARGMWMGGNLPLGYDPPKDLMTRALVVNSAEAETVRLIFHRYLDLGSAHALKRWLDDNHIRSKAWVSSKGRQMGGARFSRGALFHLLKNRTYIGEIPHRDRTYAGAHEPILDRDTFDQVQTSLAAQARRHASRPTRVSAMLLRGTLFDVDGAPMSPTFTHGARGQVYRYYVSASLQAGGRRDISDDGIRRVPADLIETMVAKSLAALDPRRTVPISDVVARVEIHPITVQIVIRRDACFARSGDPVSQFQTLAGRMPIGHRLIQEAADAGLVRVTIPCRLKLRGGRTVVTDAAGEIVDGQPRPDPTLIKALKTAHRLLAETGGAAIAAPDQVVLQVSPAVPYERNLLRLAFLAPDLQAQILEGRQPSAVTLQRLFTSELPAAWDDQRQLFLTAD
jgi:DNA invertase Pin-like site-specific DNA recombinase